MKSSDRGLERKRATPGEGAALSYLLVMARAGEPGPDRDWKGLGEGEEDIWRLRQERFSVPSSSVCLSKL